VAIDSQKVVSQLDVNLVLNHKRPGDNVTVTLYRGGKKMDVPVKLGERTGTESVFSFQFLVLSFGLQFTVLRRNEPLMFEGFKPLNSARCFGAHFIAQRKPGLGDIADAFQLPLHFGVLGFHQFCAGIFRHNRLAERNA